MKVEYLKKFHKDMKKIKQPHDLKRIEKALLLLKSLDNVGELFDTPDVKKLVNYKKYWRIRAGNYRVGFSIKINVITFERAGHRSSFYDYYPESLEVEMVEMV